MKSTLFAAVALASLGFATAGFAGGLADRVEGKLNGSATSFAGTAGGSFGNGNSLSEAGHFSASEQTLQFDPRFGEGDSRDGITVTGTTESFSEGFDRSRVNGSSLSGALRGGWADGSVSWNGRGSDSW